MLEGVKAILKLETATRHIHLTHSDIVCLHMFSAPIDERTVKATDIMPRHPFLTIRSPIDTVQEPLQPCT